MGSVFNRGTKQKPLWYVKFRDPEKGWRMVPSHKPTKQQAKAWVEEVEGRIADGKVGILGPSTEMTFGALAEYWLTNHSAAALTSHELNTGNMPLILDFKRPHGKTLRDLPLSEVTSQVVDEFRSWCVREGSRQPGTINRRLALIRKILNDGVVWGFLKSSPKIRLLPEAEVPFSFLHLDEAKRFLAYVKENDTHNYPLYATAIYTGARMGELYGLQWRQVNLERKIITIQRSYDAVYTKSKKIRQVPINPQLGEILHEWRLRTTFKDLVFPYIKEGPRGIRARNSARKAGTMHIREKPPLGFKRLIAAADVTPIKFHDLRHTAASLMVMAGVNLQTVQKILGHASFKTTLRYAHLAPDYFGADAAKLQL